MPKLAKLIRVTRYGKEYRLEVDGQEFPWYLAREGISLNVTGGPYNDLPVVNLALLAERIEVIDAIDAPKAERVEDEAGLIRGLE